MTDYKNELWFKDLVTSKNDQDLEIDEISEILSGLDAMMWKEEFSQINDILVNSLSRNTSPMMTVTLLRKCFVIRTELADYQRLVTEAIPRMDSLCDEGSAVLDGLY